MNKFLAFLATAWICLHSLCVAAQPTFSINPTPLTGSVGQQVYADIVVDNFSNIISTGFNLTWNNTIIRYDSIGTTFGLNGLSPAAINVTAQSGTNRTMIVAWYEPDIMPTTVPNGTALLRIYFTIMQAANTSLNFSEQEVIQQIGTTTTNITNQSIFPNTPFTPAGGGVTPSGDFTMTVGTGSAANGAQQCVNVSVSGFDSIVSFQHSLSWNPAVIRLESVSGFNLTNLDNATFGTIATAATTGNLTVSWFDDSAGGVSAPNGTVIYQLCYTAIGAQGTSTPISITNTPTPIEAAATQNGVASETTMLTQNGSFTVTSGGTAPPPCNPGAGFYLIGSQETAVNGGTACIDITAKDFNDLISTQYTLGWDPARLQFSSVEIPVGTANILGLEAGNFNTGVALTSIGQLGVSWESSTGTGVDVPGNTVLYSVCFTALNIDNAGAAVVFTSNPIPIEIVTDNPPNSIVPFHSCPGYLYTGAAPVVNPLGVTGTVQGFCQPESSGTGGGGNTTPCEPGNSLYMIGSDPVGDVGTQVCMDVTVNGFVNIVSAQYSINWDPAVLQYASITVPPGASNVLGLGAGSNFNAMPALTSTGRISFLWFDNNAVGVSLPNGSLIYTVCFTVLQDVPTSVTFTGNPNPIEIVNTNGTMLTMSTCVGEINAGGGTPPVVNNNGSIDVTMTNGNPPYTYLWTGPNGFSATTQDISSLSEGVYTVSITDAQGQDTIISYTVGVLSIDGTASPATSGNNGAITTTVQGGSYPTYTFAWTGPNGFTSTAQNLTNIAAGTYIVAVTDAANCTKRDTIIVNNNNAPLAIGVTTITNVACFGQSTGAINITPSGGASNYTYQWSNGAGTTEDISNRPAGTYTVTVTDGAGSTITAQATITQPANALTVNVTATPEIVPPGNNGTIVVVASGGTPNYTYTWNQPGIGNTGTALGLSTNNYIVTVTDANGCTVSTGIVPVPQTNEFTVTQNVTNANCANTPTGAIDLSITGGSNNFMYAWSSGQSTQDLSGLMPGVYVVTITDNVTTIQKVVTITVSANSALITITLDNIVPQQGIDINNAELANGQVYISVSGGSGTFNYTWNNGYNSQDLLDIVSGTYMVTVTDATTACTATSPNYIVPSLIGLHTSTITPACNGNGGCIDFTIYGGEEPFTYTWSNGDMNNTSSRTISKCGLAAGTYGLTITDALGQQYPVPSGFVVPNTAITIPTPVIAEATNGCNGSILISPEGAAQPATYSWSNGTTNQNLLNVCAGSYQVTITDANNCSSTSQILVVPGGNVAIQVSGQVTPSNCPLANDGAINVSIVGGTPSYTYAWMYNGNPTDITTEDVSNAAAGTWTLIITDQAGSTVTRDFVVSTLSTLTTSPVTVQQPAVGQCNGVLSVAVPTGVPPYQFGWSNGQSTQQISELCAGEYSVTVTDGAGCTMIETLTLSSSGGALAAILTATQYGNFQISCNGECDGIVGVNVSGGSGIYTYLWSNGQTSSQASNLCAGEAKVTITDTNGNTTVATTILTAPQPLTANITATPAPNGNDGVAQVVAAGGTGSYTYRWSDDNQSTTDRAIALRPGEYFVLVSDANLCSILQSVIIQGEELGDDKCFVTVSPVITPNDDGMNDQFQIFCADTHDNTLQIFDRWGRSVLQATNYQNDWTGKEKGGDVLPDGAYFYVFDVITNAGDRKQYKGSFSIITR